MDLLGRRRLERVVAPSLLGALLAGSGCSLPRYEDYANVKAASGGGGVSDRGAGGQAFSQAGTSVQVGHGGDSTSGAAGGSAASGAAGDNPDAAEGGGGASLGGGGSSAGSSGGPSVAGGGGSSVAGGGGSSVAGGGASSACVPSSNDSTCDGLDASCKPTLSESVCPSGCKGVRYSGKSYMGCAVSVSFSDAEILCQQQGMDLVQIDGATENNFVVQLAQTLGSYVWIGGSDLEQLGTFSWIRGAAFYDNGPVRQAYENFDTGEPSTNAGLDCVHLHDDQPGPWSTTRCSDAQQFICEAP